jgi:hypothetical protein
MSTSASGSVLSSWLGLVVSVVGGAALATVVTVGLVASQSGEPATNPANQPVLVYGD